MIKRKWLIGGVLLLLIIVAVVLGVTLGEKDTDGPVPPPPVDAYNPYSVDEGSIVKKHGVMTGNLTLS